MRKQEQLDTLLLFTPHVPARVQAGGWTAQRQIAFIAALARTGVVREAADSVGMSARSAYGLRTRAACTANRLVDVPLPPDQLAAFGPGWTFSFAHAWDLALRHGLGLQMEAALPAAIEKDSEPVVRRGRIVGWREKFNSRLALNALSAWRRYNEGAAYDHELRIAERTHRLAQSLEALFDKGPAVWPSPAQLNASMGCACCGKVPRDPPDGEGPDGFRRFGVLDPYGPADRPPRPAAEQNREPPPPRRPRPMPRITTL